MKIRTHSICKIFWKTNSTTIQLRCQGRGFKWFNGFKGHTKTFKHTEWNKIWFDVSWKLTFLVTNFGLDLSHCRDRKFRNDAQLAIYLQSILWSQYGFYYLKSTFLTTISADIHWGIQAGNTSIHPTHLNVAATKWSRLVCSISRKVDRRKDLQSTCMTFFDKNYFLC